MPDWQIWIDTGGTFTDCLARDPEGRPHQAKVLSSSALRGLVREPIDEKRLSVHEQWSAPPGFITGFEFRLLDTEHPPRTVIRFEPAEGLVEVDGPLRAAPGMVFEVCSPEEAPVLAARIVTATPAGAPLPDIAMRLATTRGTNALLERRGVPVALFISRGFGDLLRIGTQQRPELFALHVVKPDPLYEAVVEVEERLAADGTVLRKLHCEPLLPQVRHLLERGVRAAAVALMHSHRNPAHERELVRFLQDCGFEHVSASADLAPFIKLLPRAETTVVDAYLGPVIKDYLSRVQGAIRGGTLHVMTSTGGLLQTQSFQAKDSLLSGPAGGVAGAALVGRRAGFERLIGFDMGGTSTDVARYDGDFEYVFEHDVGDAHLVAPALAIETVAAGGGSICRFAEGRLQVGPQSAGARPGPACYGAGGPLTLTDVNLLLGRLHAERFEIPIRPERAREQLDALRRRLAEETAEEAAPEALIEGFLDIANERMAAAIRRVSLQRGYDPAAYALVAFGGAGAQHACGVALRLGIDTVLVPADASLLSALGIGHAVIERFVERQVLALLEEVEAHVPAWLDALGRKAVQEVAAEGVPEAEVVVRRQLLNLRFIGQDTPLTVEYEAGTSLSDAFAAAYKTLYGHQPEGRPVELESIRVIASSRASGAEREQTSQPAHEALPSGNTKTWVQGKWTEVAVHNRPDLKPGAQLQGPALIFERHSAVFVDAGWGVGVDRHATLVLHRRQPRTTRGREARPEAVRLELFTHNLSNIAREMGTMLQRTALSTNVKERLDFSCALLDANGELVVNAPHIPVHLGALGLCVRRVREHLSLKPGDTVITNHPDFGGSHLPDITLITPVYAGGDPCVGYVASRAHHAEVGGMRPGSMPPAATNLAQEGVVIPPSYIVRDGRADWTAVRDMLQNAPFPSRTVDDNLADLRAALAANHRGLNALQDLACEYGAKTLLYYMAALKNQADRGLRSALSRLPDGCYGAQERLDDGSPLQVRIDITGDSASIDFSGSAGVHPGNLNATPAIVRSAVIYVLRLLVDAPLPLNEGFMEPIALHIPPGILNPPFPEDPARAPAVVGGNVETSQRLVDTLLKALELVACSQGTMNNVLFGTTGFGYYETVGGGCGAGPTFAGADAVHSHMTNTRITDPEIVEHRYPVRIDRFAVRKGSGGAGAHAGGDGIVRELTFLKEMALSVLTQHRKEGPYGLHGADPGKPGTQVVHRASGEKQTLGPVDGCEVAPGDRLILNTPGGGGYGRQH